MSESDSESGGDISGSNKMSILTDSQVISILKSIEDTDAIPWCSGAMACPSDTLPLFYQSCHSGDDNSEAGKERKTVVQRIDMFSATSGELEELSKACDPAPFGMNRESVLDESYRKAGKLDLENFALNFFPEPLGFTSIIKKALLTPRNRDIVFERYKINVYGKGSFFKPHKDTPRSQNMFGSLVVIFPTPHEGGALAVSHGKHSSTINFAGILKDQPANTVAFAAFYSDVNHEVTKVTSGHRVSMTFNLYYGKDGKSISENDLNKVVHTSTNTFYEDAYAKLQTTMSQLLQDAEFLSTGGILCFRLAHEYAIPSETTRWTHGVKPLDHLKKFLKGSDAVIHNVCADLGLTTALKVIYDREGSQDFGHTRYYLSDDELVFNDTYGESHDIIEAMQKYCLKVNINEDFTWVRWQLPEEGGVGTTIETSYLVYGNEPDLDYAYGMVSLLVGVGPRDKREAFDMDENLKKKHPHKGRRWY